MSCHRQRTGEDKNLSFQHLHKMHTYIFIMVGKKNLPHIRTGALQVYTQCTPIIFTFMQTFIHFYSLYFLHGFQFLQVQLVQLMQIKQHTQHFQPPTEGTHILVLLEAFFRSNIYCELIKALTPNTHGGGSFPYWMREIFTRNPQLFINIMGHYSYILETQIIL